MNEIAGYRSSRSDMLDRREVHRVKKVDGSLLIVMHLLMIVIPADVDGVGIYRQPTVDAFQNDRSREHLKLEGCFPVGSHQVFL
jgi:hypothetical protein